MARFVRPAFAHRPRFVEEDRARDWHCGQCRERNFAKRMECFKCKLPRPPESFTAAGIPKPPPPSGTTLNGMVKSYNKKGFGFIMAMGRDDCQDVFYTRDSVSSRLLHPDMPGEHVTFEIYMEGRKLVAKNIRPLGEDRRTAMAPGRPGSNGHVMGKNVFVKGYEEEDQTRDWICTSCKERNFLRRFECFKCKSPRPAGFTDASAAPSSTSSAAPRRTFSPHAGSRAVRDSLAGDAGDKSRSRSSRRRKALRNKKSKKRRRSSSRSSSSSSRSKKRAKARRKNCSSSGSSSRRNSSKKNQTTRGRSRDRSNSSSCVVEEPASSSGNPDIEKAKHEALDQLIKLRSIKPAEARAPEWRALLRKWHPDKNPDRVEVATAVFQFLQKSKSMLDAAG